VPVDRAFEANPDAKESGAAGTIPANWPTPRCCTGGIFSQGRRDVGNLLGGNGIFLEYHVMRHMADIEALHTYEGTETIQTLIVGRDITGVGAFT